MITRFLVIEDLPSFIRGGGSLVETSPAAGRASFSLMAGGERGTVPAGGWKAREA
jgi:hypothetical protein